MTAGNPHPADESQRLTFPILPQPDESTCGPTALHAVYRYFDDDIALRQVIDEIPMLESGGTLASVLGLHALRRGYKVTLFTCNLMVFDPTWFEPSLQPLVDKLQQQMRVKHSKKLHAASKAYIEFLENGGRLRLEDISPSLIRRWLKRRIPIITGLSMTWLYRDFRETVTEGKDDDIRGEPVGHFAVLCGYDTKTQQVLVADPYRANPHADHHYEVPLERVLCAILLGVMTYDANLLLIEPGGPTGKRSS